MPTLWERENDPEGNPIPSIWQVASLKKGIILGKTYVNSRGVKRSRRSSSSFCKREVHLPVDVVKMPRIDQINLQNGCQNPIQFSKNEDRGKMKISKRTKLLD